jgi:hypothetical protein
VDEVQQAVDELCRREGYLPVLLALQANVEHWAAFEADTDQADDARALDRALVAAVRCADVIEGPDSEPGPDLEELSKPPKGTPGMFFGRPCVWPD